MGSEMCIRDSPKLDRPDEDSSDVSCSLLRLGGSSADMMVCVESARTEVKSVLATDGQLFVVGGLCG